MIQSLLEAAEEEVDTSQVTATRVATLTPPCDPVFTTDPAWIKYSLKDEQHQLRRKVNEQIKSIGRKLEPEKHEPYCTCHACEEQQEIQQRDSWNESVELLTLEKFKDNLNKVRTGRVILAQEISRLKGAKKDRRGNRMAKNMNGTVIPHEIKIYDDIMPIFTTMIGIMKKQEFEIDNLKQKIKLQLKYLENTGKYLENVEKYFENIGKPISKE